MQSPASVVTPNTPVIDDDNLSVILQKTDLCFSSNKSFASEETLNEYNIINAAHDSNQSLKSVPGAFELFNQILKLDNVDFSENIAALSYERNSFNKFIKFACIDYAINCERITLTLLNDERTIFFENVVPLFKYFGNITKTISFRW
jgi:hypothetical protein